MHLCRWVAGSDEKATVVVVSQDATKCSQLLIILAFFLSFVKMFQALLSVSAG
jgi:hypothetical protein